MNTYTTTEVAKIIKLSANRDFDKALMFAEEYRNQLQREKRNAEESIGIAKQILSGKSVEQTLFLKRKEVSDYLDIGKERQCFFLPVNVLPYSAR